MKGLVFSTLMLMGIAFGAHAQQLNANIEETIPGQNWTMTFSINGAASFSALSLQLALPEQIQASNITAGTALQATHEVKLGKPANGEWPIVLYSDQCALIPAEGATVTVQLSSTASLGTAEFSLYLKDIRLANVQGTEIKLKEVVLKSTGAVEPEQTLGDVNGDGEVNVADLSIVRSYILGIDTSNSKADVNGDGEVNVADLSVVRSIILGLN